MKVKLCLRPEASLLLLILMEERVQNKKVVSDNLVEKKDKLQRSRVTTTHCLATKRRTNLSRNVPRRARGVVCSRIAEVSSLNFWGAEAFFVGLSTVQHNSVLQQNKAGAM